MHNQMDWIIRSLKQILAGVDRSLKDGEREAEKESPIKSDQHSFLTGWYGKQLELTKTDLGKLIGRIDDYLEGE